MARSFVQARGAYCRHSHSRKLRQCPRPRTVPLSQEPAAGGVQSDGDEMNAVASGREASILAPATGPGHSPQPSRCSEQAQMQKALLENRVSSLCLPRPGAVNTPTYHGENILLQYYEHYVHDRQACVAGPCYLHGSSMSSCSRPRGAVSPHDLTRATCRL